MAVISSYAAYVDVAAARWRAAGAPNAAGKDLAAPWAAPVCPAVRAALSAHAARHAKRWQERRAEAAAKHARARKMRGIGRVTGRGPPRATGAPFDARAAAWTNRTASKAAAALAQMHRSAEAEAETLAPEAVAAASVGDSGTGADAHVTRRNMSCGIPRDVCARAAVRRRYHKENVDASCAKAFGVHAVVTKYSRRNILTPSPPSSCGECCLARSALSPAVATYAQRARNAFSNGITLGTRPHEAATPLPSHDTRAERFSSLSSFPSSSSATSEDTFESVLAAYGGLPDEVYRRKHSKRYAVFRRQEKARAREEIRILASAEREMKRRRGHDLLLTDRLVGETDFAPFLFDNANNCYAFSSKISDKKTMRAAMVQKYSTVIADSGMSGIELAEHHANTKELFHTRVMNRFV
jgi:hypothetical protein